MFYNQSKSNIEILGVFKITRRKYNYQSISRDYDAISMRIRGSGVFKPNDAEEIYLKRGDVLYIPQNTEYSQKTEGEMIIAVHFINHGSKNTCVETFSPPDDVSAEKILMKMYTLWTEKKPGYYYECISVFYHFLYVINRCVLAESISQSSISEYIQSALDFIHQNYKFGNISVEQLAKKAALSETYFRREFKKYCGVPPGRYISELRAEYAKQMLRSGLYTIGEVSEKTGFDDSKYFSRFFKLKFGKTPKEYQSAYVKKKK